MRLLYIVPYTPNLIRVRPYQLVRTLAQRGHQVTLAALWTAPAEQEDLERLRDLGVQVLACHLSLPRSLANCLRALPRGVPLQAAYAWHPELARLVQAAVSETGFDVVHVEHLRGARYGLAVAAWSATAPWPSSPPLRHPPVVWDSVDSISHLFQQAARSSRSLKGRWMARLELARTQRHEGRLVHRFDRVLVTSDADKQALAHLAARYRPAGGAPATDRITVLPNGVDLDYFSPTYEPREPATLVFSGKMSYHANVTAVVHLVRDIMPHVWTRRPETRVWIVGKEPPREIQALAHADARVTVFGTVPDLRPYLRRATLAVAPMPYGAGIQNKVLEALACETPVVANRQAVSALTVRPGRDLLVADGAEPFAQAVLAGLGDADHRGRLGQAGRVYVETQHAWATVAARLEGIYMDCIGCSLAA